jgi:phosphoribosyl 1,2-cyclic phosphodiesterase
MLPARERDCLWIRYGDARKPNQILIDGGRLATSQAIRACFAALPVAQRTFELLIITHVDRDHIEGVLGLLEDTKFAVKFKDIWFNGYDHLKNTKLETFHAYQQSAHMALLWYK